MKFEEIKEVIDEDNHHESNLDLRMVMSTQLTKGKPGSKVQREGTYSALLVNSVEQSNPESRVASQRVPKPQGVAGKAPQMTKSSISSEGNLASIDSELNRPTAAEEGSERGQGRKAVTEILYKFKQKMAEDNVDELEELKTFYGKTKTDQQEQHFYGHFNHHREDFPTVVCTPNKSKKFVRHSAQPSVSDAAQSQYLVTQPTRKKTSKQYQQLEDEEELQHEVHDAVGRFICTCSVCVNQIRPFGPIKNPFKATDIITGITRMPSTVHKVPDKLKHSLSVIDRDNFYKRYGGFQKDFLWLIKHLLPFNPDRIKGCELIFPDTVFFKDGKPHLIVKMDKDFCLQGIRNAGKLNLHNLYKDFQNVARERRKDNIGVFLQKYGANLFKEEEFGRLNTTFVDGRSPTKTYTDHLTSFKKESSSMKIKVKSPGKVNKTVLFQTTPEKKGLHEKSVDSIHEDLLDLDRQSGFSKDQPTKAFDSQSKEGSVGGEASRGVYFKDVAIIRFFKDEPHQRAPDFLESGTRSMNSLQANLKMSTQQKSVMPQRRIAVESQVSSKQGDLSRTDSERDASTSKASNFLSQFQGFPIQKMIEQQGLANIDKNAFGISPTVHVVTDNGLMQVFHKRASDEYWRTVNCIQTNVKSKVGCGFPIIVKFYAQIDHDHPEKEIAYDFRSFGEDEDLIRGDTTRYCIKQVYKMCYYVSKLYKYEILRMKCIFVKDDNNTVWFTYASEIFMRPNINAKKEAEQQLAAMKKINRDQKQRLENDIKMRIHQESEKITKIQNVMDDQYAIMKNKIGIDEVIEDRNSDYETEQAYRQLRPTSSFTFEQEMQRFNDPVRKKRIAMAKIRLHSKQRRETQQKQEEFQKPKNLRFPVGRLQRASLQSAGRAPSSRNMQMLPQRTRTPLEHRSHMSNEPNSSVTRFGRKEKSTPRETQPSERGNSLMTRLKANVYAFPEKEALEQKQKDHIKEQQELQEAEEREQEEGKPVVEQFMYDKMKIPIEKIHQAIDDRLSYLCKRTTYKSHRIGSLIKLRNQSIQNMNQLGKQSQLQRSQAGGSTTTLATNNFTKRKANKCSSVFDSKHDGDASDQVQIEGTMSYPSQMEQYSNSRPQTAPHVKKVGRQLKSKNQATNKLVSQSSLARLKAHHVFNANRDRTPELNFDRVQSAANYNQTEDHRMKKMAASQICFYAGGQTLKEQQPVRNFQPPDDISVFTGESALRQQQIQDKASLMNSRSMRSLREIQKKNVNYHKDQWKVVKPSQPQPYGSTMSAYSAKTPTKRQPSKLKKKGAKNKYLEKIEKQRKQGNRVDPRTDDFSIHGEKMVIQASNIEDSPAKEEAVVTDGKLEVQMEAAKESIDDEARYYHGDSSRPSFVFKSLYNDPKGFNSKLA